VKSLLKLTFESLLGGPPSVPPWTGVGFSVVIYVEWFKTEVNRWGKQREGALLRMPRSFLEFVTPHSSRPRRDCISNSRF
jgi:hypothetical protein